MRRLGPRPLAGAVERVAAEAAPATVLARVQRVWPEVAGEHVAREAEPIGERAAEVTVACSSAAWANELEMLSRELVARLNDALAPGADEAPVRRLRLVTRSVSRVP